MNGKFAASELKKDTSYVIIKNFVDYDNQEHKVGDQWLFLRDSFLPYENGLSLFIQKNDQEFHIRLQWRAEEQEEIIENFNQYAQPI